MPHTQGGYWINGLATRDSTLPTPPSPLSFQKALCRLPSRPTGRPQGLRLPLAWQAVGRRQLLSPPPQGHLYGFLVLPTPQPLPLATSLLSPHLLPSHKNCNNNNQQHAGAERCTYQLIYFSQQSVGKMFLMLFSDEEYQGTEQ